MEIVKKYLNEFGCTNKHSTYNKIINYNKTFIQLRNDLLKLGTILLEDLENNIYIVSIKSGKMKINNAVVICKYEKKNLYMYAFAKEGWIKQGTCKKAIEMIEDVSNG